MKRKIDYMPGSKSIEVKKECRLGGLGTKSKECNQGDINNLTLKRISEEVLAQTTKGVIYKNPPTIKRMEGNVKGIIDRDGNLFVIDGDSQNMTHIEFAVLLGRYNAIPMTMNVYDDISDYVLVERVVDNTMYLSQSYSSEKYFNDSTKPRIKNILKSAKEKCPKITFIMQTSGEFEAGTKPTPDVIIENNYNITVLREIKKKIGDLNEIISKRKIV